jgi:hypothetical protein
VKTKRQPLLGSAGGAAQSLEGDDEGLLVDLDPGERADHGDRAAQGDAGLRHYEDLGSVRLEFDASVFEARLHDLQDDPEVALGLAEESNAPAPHDLSELGRPRQSLGPRRQLAAVTEEDFALGPEREAFVIIMGHARNLFARGTSVRKQEKAVEFFFCESASLITFGDCCGAIDTRIRQNVLRLRLHYEFLQRTLVFAAPFPFETVPPPAGVVNETAFALQMQGSDTQAGNFVCHELWRQPGLHVDELVCRAHGHGISAESLHRAMQLMWSKYFISPSTDYWYLTGRNPARQIEDAMANRSANAARPGNLYWSRLFG